MTFVGSMIALGAFAPSHDGPPTGPHWKISLMKEFTDADGQRWTATAIEEEGTD